MVVPDPAFMFYYFTKKVAQDEQHFVRCACAKRTKKSGTLKTSQLKTNEFFGESHFLLQSCCQSIHMHEKVK